MIEDKAEADERLASYREYKRILISLINTKKDIDHAFERLKLSSVETIKIKKVDLEKSLSAIESTLN